MKIKIRVRWLDLPADLLEVVAYTEDGFVSVPLRIYGRSLSVDIIQSWLANAVRAEYELWKSRQETKTSKLVRKLEEMEFEL